MKERGRIRLEKVQVQHGDKFCMCFICGKPANHRVFGFTQAGRLRRKGIDYCTHHFVQSYKMPPSRFSKMVRKYERPVLSERREFTLRRHLDAPYSFLGERIACHDYKCGKETFYFSLYFRDAGSSLEQVDYTYVVSLTRVFDKTAAINMVKVGPLGSVVHMVKLMIADQHAAAEIEGTVRLDVEATKFIEKCYQLRPIAE